MTAGKEIVWGVLGGLTLKSQALKAAVRVKQEAFRLSRKLTMLLSMLVFVLWGTAPALAQLPPEIQADSYLLRAEQAIGEGDPVRARAEIGKIIELEKEHELDLREEFHFRYAKAAATAGLPEQALETVVKYLTTAGREGRHYVEALELMNQVQDAIEGSRVSTADQTGAEEPSEVQQDQQAQLDAAGTSKGQPLPDCGQWNTEMFFRAATVASVTACIDSGSDPKARDKWGYTPLHHAAQYNENPAVTEALLKAGADPMAQNESGFTPLHWAASYNENPAVIEALLKAGADPNARDKWGDTPLHDAARSNENAAVTEALLKAGADPTAQNESGGTPLHRAAWSNANAALTEILLKAGADAGADLQWTPLHEAAALNENPAAIEALLKAGADPMARTKSRVTPLHCAAKYNANAAVTEALLKAGADPNARVKRWGDTPLHQAAKYNENPAAIEALLKAGADPKARARSRVTPLHRAARYNENPAVIEALLKAGADPNVRNKWGSTPLHSAAYSNENAAVTEALLKAGADPKARDKWGDTPLHDAASSNENQAVTETLLKAGADLAALDEDNHTPLFSTRYNDNPAVRQVLLAAGAGQVERQVERQRAAGQARRQARSGPGFLEAAIAIAGGTAIAAAGEGSDEALEAGAVFAGGVIGGASDRGSASGVPAAASSGNVDSGTGGGSCEIPRYPSPPGGVANLGLAWCPSGVSMQARALALQAAGAQCAIATGSSSTPEQIQARRREIAAACGRLAALAARDGIPCRCPAGYGP